MLIKFKDDIQFERIEDESYFIDLLSGRYIHNNSTATYFISELSNQQELDIVIPNIVNKYSIEEQVVLNDIIELVKTLNDSDLLKSHELYEYINESIPK